MAYSFEMVLVGMILLSAMVAGGITLKIKRRRHEAAAALAESLEDNIDSETSDKQENTPNR